MGVDWRLVPEEMCYRQALAGTTDPKDKPKATVQPITNLAKVIFFILLLSSLNGLQR
jgi:hypothetical protein